MSPLSRLAQPFRDPNPILRKELLGVLRTPLYLRALTASVLVLSSIVVAVAASSSDRYDHAQTGQAVFLLFFGGAALSMIVTGSVLGASAVSQEREARTLEALTLTGMPPWRLLLGKCLSVFAATALVPVAAVPILSMVGLFGGVNLGQIVIATGYTLTWGLFAVVFGAGVSAHSAHVRYAVFGALLLAFVGTFFGAALLTSLGHDLHTRYGLGLEGPFFFVDAYSAIPWGPEYRFYLITLPGVSLGLLLWGAFALGLAGLLEPGQDRTLPLKRWLLGAVAAGLGALAHGHAVFASTPRTRGVVAFLALAALAVVCLQLGFLWVTAPLATNPRMAREHAQRWLGALTPPTQRASFVWLLGVFALGAAVVVSVTARGDHLALASAWGLGWLATHLGLVGALANRKAQPIGSARAIMLGVILFTSALVWLVAALLRIDDVDRVLSIASLSPIWLLVAVERGLRAPSDPAWSAVIASAAGVYGLLGALSLGLYARNARARLVDGSSPRG